MQREDGSAVTHRGGIGLLLLLDNTLRQRIELTLRAFHGNAGLQPAGDREVVGGPPGHAVRVDVDRNEGLYAPHGDTGRQNPHHATVDAVQRQDTAEQRPFAAEPVLPELVRDDDHWLFASPSIFALEA